MKKLPFMKWFAGDWLKDPKVSRCSPQTRGVWFDLLCAMHEDGRTGEISGSIEELAHIGRCSFSQMQEVIKDLIAQKTANVTIKNKNVTISNRRMVREHKLRQEGRLRVRRHRGNGAVTKMFETPFRGHISEDLRYTNETRQKMEGQAELRSNSAEKIASRGRDACPTFFPDGYIEQLQKKTAYAEIDVRDVVDKMIAWCEVRRLKPTRRRLVSWLNSEDRPIGGSKDASDKAKIDRVVEGIVKDRERGEETRGSS